MSVTPRETQSLDSITTQRRALLDSTTLLACAEDDLTAAPHETHVCVIQRFLPNYGGFAHGKFCHALPRRRFSRATLEDFAPSYASF